MAEDKKNTIDINVDALSPVSVALPAEERAKELIETNKSWGRFLYRFAWGIELFAVAIGIFFAISTLIISYSGSQDRDWNLFLNAVMGALPWFAAASAELTKIPLSIGLYRSTKRAWKAGFSVALILLVIITWETMFGGLERNFTVQTDELSRIEAVIDGLEDEIERKEKQNQLLSQISYESINENFSTENNRIDEEERQSLQDIEQNYNILINQKRNEIILLREGRTNDLIIQKEEERDKKLKNFNEKIEQDKKSINAVYQEDTYRIDKVIDDLRLALKNALDTLAQSNEWGKGGKRNRLNLYYENLINKENEKLLKAKEQRDTDLDNLKSEEDNFQKTVIAPLEDEISKLKEQEGESQNLDERISELNKQITNLNSRRDQESLIIKQNTSYDRERLNKIKQTELDDFNNSEKLIKENTKSIDDNNKKIEEKRAETRESRLEIQVYRFTLIFMNIFPGMFSDSDLSEDSKKEVYEIADVDGRTAQIVAFAWFGGLAFVIATIGIALAIGSEILKDMNSLVEREEQGKQKKIIEYFKDILRSILGILGSIIKFFRGVTAASWKRLRKPRIKTVIKYEDKIKEVPVEKIVEKEVPKEVIKEVVKWKTRIVQIPLYSTQPGMIELSPNILQTNLSEQNNTENENRNDDNTSVSEQYIPVSAHTILKTIKLEDGKDIQVRAGKWGGYYLKYGQGNYSVGSGIDIRDIDQELAMDIIGLESTSTNNEDKEKNQDEPPSKTSNDLNEDDDV